MLPWPLTVATAICNAGRLMYGRTTHRCPAPRETETQIFPVSRHPPAELAGKAALCLAVLSKRRPLKRSHDDKGGGALGGDEAENEPWNTSTHLGRGP